MDNSIKTECDKLSVAKDIAERQSIIHKFETTGFLDRNEAINKVTSLQITDAELLTATKLKQAASGSVNLYQADDNTIFMCTSYKRAASLSCRSREQSLWNINKLYY